MTALQPQWDVIVAGGGPTGLAVAITAARQGLAVLVLEQRPAPPDKACGEGLLPPGVAALDRLGVRRYLDDDAVHRFAGIRFLDAGGDVAAAHLPAGGGLGVRRTVLVEAMTRRARDAGAEVRHACGVRDVDRESSGAVVRTTDGTETARLVVAADGLHSPLRHAAGLDRRGRGPRRFALRQHYQMRPWTDFVEVYVDDAGEAVVTPVAPDRINVNFTWEHHRVRQPDLDTLLARFPVLEARLRGAIPASSVRGAGPMAHAAVRRTADRLVLIGDAAGFVDSIAADGLSVAFNSALLLGAALPDVVAAGASQRSLRRYERHARRLYRHYAAVTHGLLWVARHPHVRRRLIHRLGRHQALCGSMMSGAMRLMLAASPAR